MLPNDYLITMNFYMKNQIKYIFTLLTISQLALAQEKNETLATFVRQAIEYSPRIKEQQQLAASGEFRKKITETNLLPQVNGEVSYARIDPVGKALIPIPGVDGAIQFLPNNNYNTNIGATYLIYDWGKTKASVEKTLLEIQQTNTGIEGLKHTLAYQVASLYYGIIYLQKAIEVQKKQIVIGDENGKLVNNRIKNGDALDYESLQGEVRTKNLVIRLVDLQGQLEKQYIYLSNLTGQDVRKMMPTNGSFKTDSPEISIENAYSQAISNSWDIKMLKDKAAIISKDIALAKINGLPNLGASATVGLKNGIQPDINQFRLNSQFGFRLTMPIYTGKKGVYQESLAKTNLDANNQAIESQKLTLSRDIENANNDLKIAKQKFDLAERNIYQAEYGLKLARTRLTNGVSTPLEMQTAETMVEEAQFNQLQYEYQMTLAKLELNRLTGLKFW